MLLMNSVPLKIVDHLFHHCSSATSPKHMYIYTGSFTQKHMGRIYDEPQIAEERKFPMNVKLLRGENQMARVGPVSPSAPKSKTGGWTPKVLVEAK